MKTLFVCHARRKLFDELLHDGHTRNLARVFNKDTDHLIVDCEDGVISGSSLTEIERILIKVWMCFEDFLNSFDLSIDDGLMKLCGKEKTTSVVADEDWIDRKLFLLISDLFDAQNRCRRSHTQRKRQIADNSEILCELFRFQGKLLFDCLNQGTLFDPFSQIYVIELCHWMIQFG